MPVKAEKRRARLVVQKVCRVAVGELGEVDCHRLVWRRVVRLAPASIDAARGECILDNISFQMFRLGFSFKQ